jgi:dUTPase
MLHICARNVMKKNMVANKVFQSKERGDGGFGSTGR